MKDIVIKWIVNVAALFAVVYIMSGLSPVNFGSVVLAAAVIGLLNAFLRPVLIMLTLPINMMSLGIFTLFINGFIFYMTAKLVPGLNISTFGSAFWSAILFSIISIFLNIAIVPGRRLDVKTYDYTCRNQNDRDIIDVEGKVED